MGTRRNTDCCRACGSYETDSNNRLKCACCGHIKTIYPGKCQCAICTEEKKRKKEGLPSLFPFSACSAHIRKNLEHFSKEAGDWAQTHR